MSSQPDVTEGCYVRTLPHPPNEIKEARLVYVDGGPHDQNENGGVYPDLSAEEVDNIYENIPGEENDRANIQTLV